MIDICSLPPIGWKCTRAAKHSGPCAAVETSKTYLCQSEFSENNYVFAAQLPEDAARMYRTVVGAPKNTKVIVSTVGSAVEL